MSLISAATAPKRAEEYRTVSLALPGSIIENIQDSTTATAVAGQIARTAAIFNVDEVVVFDDSRHSTDSSISAGTAFLARMLLFMETPQYLRKALIPVHPDFRTVGLLPPLDAPHHLRATEWGPYREGVVQECSNAFGSTVDIGLDHSALVNEVVPVGTRITLCVGEKPTLKFVDEVGQQLYLAKVVSPRTPRLDAGLYWGYSTRIAQSLHHVFSECPYSSGYDLKIGTSEHGGNFTEYCDRIKFNHLLLAFGGLNGLEDCIRNDLALSAKGPEQVFDLYVNTCPGQGSRTIRTEEALLISFGYMKAALDTQAL